VEVIMIPGQPVVLAIDDASGVGQARRTAAAMAGRLGFDATGLGRVAIVVTEAATNLFKHAVGGELILQEVEDGERRGLEVLALDRGPGMADVSRCQADGFSTAGSPGNGLGAMARLTSSLEIHSAPGSGTALAARLWTGPSKPSALEWGAVCLPMPGEEVCGDAWSVQTGGHRHMVMVVDGLGHGPQAAEASREAVRVFEDRAGHEPAEIVRLANEALRGTRGAAMAITLIDTDRREARYCGAGNISATLVDPEGRRRQSMVSHNGTVGHAVRKVQEFSYPWPAGSALVMHSDGLTSHWQLEQHAGLATRHPSLAAGVLYRDFRRGRDDVTVLVVSERRETSP
jgi:anti-sigma regulatory factor (Ser/Thr protein kinase)